MPSKSASHSNVAVLKQAAVIKASSKLLFRQLELKKMACGPMSPSFALLCSAQAVSTCDAQLQDEDEVDHSSCGPRWFTTMLWQPADAKPISKFCCQMWGALLVRSGKRACASMSGSSKYRWCVVESVFLLLKHGGQERESASLQDL